MSYLKEQYSQYTSAHLLQRRALGDELSEEAHAAIEEIFAERGEPLPPRPAQAVLVPDEGPTGSRTVRRGELAGALIFFIVSTVAANILARTWIGWLSGALTIGYLVFRVLYQNSLTDEKRKQQQNKQIERDEQMTEVMVAASAGDLTRVRELLDYGGDVNATTVSGNTALMYAARNDHSDVALLLLARNADLDTKNKHGSTAAAIAERFGHVELKALLDSHRFST